jgi:ubiquinol-cytochrome c reductase iron-sulfur subunit
VSPDRRGDDPRTDHGSLRIIRERVPEPDEAVDAIVIASSLVTVVGGLVFAIGVVAEWPIEVHGTALAAALVAFTVGFRRYFASAYPQIEAAEERPDFEQPGDPISDVMMLSRRKMLTRVLGAAAAFLALGALAPITSLGPRYREPVSGWGDGVRLINEMGTPIRPEDVPPSGVAVVWPEDALRREHASVMLVRLRQPPVEPTNLDWVVDDTLVAYSKVCTHAGCPVGLFREIDASLFCPCHQASFDASRGAAPATGPTARPLPQLPLTINDDGFVVAAGDFTEPIGPPQG